MLWETRSTRPITAPPRLSPARHRASSRGSGTLWARGGTLALCCTCPASMYDADQVVRLRGRTAAVCIPGSWLRGTNQRSAHLGVPALPKAPTCACHADPPNVPRAHVGCNQRAIRHHCSCRYMCPSCRRWCSSRCRHADESPYGSHGFRLSSCLLWWSGLSLEITCRRA